MLVTFEVRREGMSGLEPSRFGRIQARAYRRAGATAARDMKSEAKKRVRMRKRLKASLVAKALETRKPRGSKLEEMEIALDVTGAPLPLIAYPHSVTRRGVTVGVNKGGGRTLLEDAFVARMPSGHKGLFRREGGARLPIRELRGSRPVDALLHEGEAEKVGERGLSTLLARFPALLELELEKAP
jgi:hypothetical protein